MYFKILKEDLRHHGFQYKEGLNVDTKRFNPSQKYGGGLFFTDEKSIFSFLDCGTKIADVTIPDGEPVVSVDSFGTKKYKAHRIVLSNIRELYTVETFKQLIAARADIHVWNDYALRCAAYNGHHEIVKCLVEAGADIHACEDEALRFAAENGHLEVVKHLITAGADIHVWNDEALRYAAESGHIEVVKCLIKARTDIHACDDYALRYAADNGHLEVVKCLIEAGADSHACDDIALYYAEKNGHLEVAKLLIEAEAQLEVSSQSHNKV